MASPEEYLGMERGQFARLGTDLNTPLETCTEYEACETQQQEKKAVKFINLFLIQTFNKIVNCC